jgi:hypothetical protein
MSPEDPEQPVDTGPIGAVTAFPVRTGQETAAPAPSHVPVFATGVTERSAAPSSHDALPRRLPARTGAGPTTAERTVEDAGGERTAASGEQQRTHGRCGGGSGARHSP